MSSLIFKIYFDNTYFQVKLILSGSDSLNMFKKHSDKRTTCIKQGFWPHLKPKIESHITTFSLDCFIRRMTKVILFHIDLTLTAAMVTENSRQYRLK